MMQRCYKPKVERYPHYGGRGITVCNEWHEFSNFYEWSLNNGWVVGLSIERIDNDKGYSPDNCKYIPIYEQHLNKTNTVTFLEKKERKCYACGVIKHFEKFSKSKRCLAGIDRICKDCAKVKRDFYKNKKLKNNLNA
jgi:hypothetical protein